MNLYKIGCCLFIIIGFCFPLLFDSAIMDGNQLIARVILSVGASISCAILSNNSKTK